MSAAEIWARLSERALEWRERSEAGKTRSSIWACLATTVGDAGSDQALLGLRRETAPRLLNSLRDVERTRRAFQAQFPSHVAPAVALADELRAHRIRFFGQTFDLGPDIDWQADPVSGRTWPAEYRCDIPLTSAPEAPGDPKDVWELNRHQYLVDLAKAWLLTRDRRYAQCVYALVDSWIAANPYGFGINWTGPLEPAYRALSWLWSYYLCLDDPDLPAGFHSRWMQAFHDHGRFLHRHLERFSSPYNHLIGEASALYLLGLACPEFRESAAWRERGRRTLEHNLPAQFYDDGGSVEQATLYHHATLGFYLLAEVAARGTGDRIAGARERIERAIEFAMRLSLPDGVMPMIGDTDDARPVRFEERALWDFRDFQAAGAVMFGRGDFKHASGGWAEDAFWLLGPEAYDAYDAIAAAPPVERFTLLRSSGYAALRTSWAPDADYVCFDCGEQSGGLRTDDIPSAAHGHADALSVVVCLAGRQVLVDPGFFTYNGDRSWERFFRETAAHNTIRIDGRDQATHLEKMAWVKVARVTIDRWEPTDGGAVVAASHDGYARSSSSPVWHRRTVVLTDRGYVIIRDELTGAGGHGAEVVFQCAPGLAHLKADRATFDDRFDIVWSSSHPWAARLTCGGTGPESGWIAPGLSRRVAAPRLVLTGRWRKREVTLVSVVADRERVEVDLDGALQFVVRGRGFTHRVDATRLSEMGTGAVPRHGSEHRE